MPANQLPTPFPSESLTEKFPFHEVSVLVVEDAPQFAGIVAGILKSFGIGKIYPARNGEDALHILAHQRVHVVLVDDLEPPLDGRTVVKTLRKPDSGLPNHVPVIFMTERPFKTNVIAVRDSGATEVLSKPFSATQLMTRIESVLRRPRPLIHSGDFDGPDRRRQVKAAPEKKRASDRDAE